MIKLKEGQVIEKFQTNTMVLSKVELKKQLDAKNFRDGSAELWTVLIDNNYIAEIWIPVDSNNNSSL